MKLPTLTGTNVEEFYLAFTAAFRIHSDLIGIPLDYFLRPDAVRKYNLAWNTRQEKIKFCAKLQVQDFNDDTETLYNLLFKYVSKSETGGNTVSRHTSLNNVCTCYLELKGDFKTKAYEEIKASKANAIPQSAQYDEKGS